MAFFPNTPETNKNVRKNLKAHGYSERVIDEIIDTITAVDRTKDNLWVSQLHQSATEKISFIEKMYDEGSKPFYKYLKHLNPSLYMLNKSILQKYKSNICKYLYIISADKKGIDPHEAEFVESAFWSIKRTDKILHLMEKIEELRLGDRKDVLIAWDRQLNNPWLGMSWDNHTQDKVQGFLKEQATGTTSHGAHSTWL